MDETPVKKTNSLTLRVISSVILIPLVLFCLIAGELPFIVFLAIAFFISIKELFGMSVKMPRSFYVFLSGLVYIALCMASFLSLRLHQVDGMLYVLALVLAVWATDIGAYFTGKTFKGPKMSPSISPNKTWAGLIGGTAASAAVLCAFKTYAPALFAKVGLGYGAMFYGVDLWKVALIGVVVAIVGQIGDLFISILKRRAGVKDTGALIPGHGGILDRIDSLLLAAPAFTLCLELMAL